MSYSVRLIQGDGNVVTGLICSLSQTHLDDVLDLWRPMLVALGEADAFWDWVRKKRLSLGELGYEAYVLEVETLTQGLLWLETQRHRSQIDRTQRLVYVEAIASAPWNRRSINPDPYLRGVGTLLLQFARRRSLDLGYNGRIGLHALPGSEAFYESQNMLDGGVDPDYDDMIYYEYTAIDRQRWEERNNGF
jgi:GNAT superfamily N-acetyltransferase